jgi:hypothetical protein
LIQRELDKLAEKVKPYYSDGNSHAEACELLAQELYVSFASYCFHFDINFIISCLLISRPIFLILQETSQKQENANVTAESRPKNWVHAHNNVWLTFRLYYKGDQLDPTFPAPKLAKEIVVPQQKPKPGDPSVFVTVPNAAGGIVTGPGGLSYGNPSKSQLNGESIENRKKILSEVREHLELLKEFEGVVDAETINKRKRDLFMALPPAPPPISSDGSADAKRPRS